MALDTVVRAQKGKKGMEDLISRAASVRRLLKAGRTRSHDVKGINSFTAMGAIGLLMGQADRARGRMRDAGLDPNDVNLGLIIRTPTDLLCKWLPTPTEAGPFFAAIAGMADAEFLGILWQQTDRETQADMPLSTYWVTPWRTEPEAQKQMQVLKDFVTAGGGRMQVN